MCKLDEVKNQNTEDDQIYRQENEKSLIPFWAAKNITDIWFDMGYYPSDIPIKNIPFTELWQNKWMFVKK